MPSPPLSSPPTATKVDQEVSYHKYSFMPYTVYIHGKLLTEYNKRTTTTPLFETTLTFHFYMHSHPFVFYSLTPFLFRSKT